MGIRLQSLFVYVCLSKSNPSMSIVVCVMIMSPGEACSRMLILLVFIPVPSYFAAPLDLDCMRAGRQGRLYMRLMHQERLEI
jgi:hypothetical protein